MNAQIPDYQFFVDNRQETKAYFDVDFRNIRAILGDYNKVLPIIDETVYRKHSHLFVDFPDKILIKGGEKNKTLAQSAKLIKELIIRNIDRNSFVLGIGGGALTDLVGFVCAVYLRGLAFGFVPTTLLAAVDASIGGKNGVNTSLYKNYIGTIRQPNLWVLDTRFFSSLPQDEWASGFAEIIKYGCICDLALFEALEAHDLSYYQRQSAALKDIVIQCLKIKTAIVMQDAQDTGLRKTLNFGHTLGHAVEKLKHIKHGQAVAIGMVYAAKLSAQVLDFSPTEVSRIERLLLRYELPIKTKAKFDKLLPLMAKDKKKSGTSIDFILLEQLGKSIIKKMEIQQLPALG